MPLKLLHVVELLAWWPEAVPEPPDGLMPEMFEPLPEGGLPLVPASKLQMAAICLGGAEPD